MAWKWIGFIERKPWTIMTVGVEYYRCKWYISFEIHLPFLMIELAWHDDQEPKVEGMK